MNTIPVFFPVALSPSMMESVDKCHTYFFREHIQHLSGFTKNPDLIAGGHVAKACELVRTGYFTQGLNPSDAIDLGYEYILSAEDTGDYQKSNENVAFCLRKYFQKFKLDEAFPPCSLADGTHAVEYKFEFDLGIPHPDLPSRNITFTGRLDYLCENATIHGTSRHGLDEKSCKSIFRLPGSKVPDYAKELAKYRTNSQILAYAWAARELGIDLKSFFIRRIPIMTDFEPAFELEVPLTKFAIDNWYRKTYNSIHNLVENYKIYKDYILGTDRAAQEVFPPTLQETACLSYSRPCRYVEGCLSKDGEYLLTERFSQRIYDRDKRIEVSLEDYLRTL